jgi:hypothetical protein
MRPSDVQAWVAGLMASGLAPSTVRLAVRLLGSIYTAAVVATSWRRTSPPSRPYETAALVLSTYGHLLPDSEDRMRRAVDDA